MPSDNSLLEDIRDSFNNQMGNLAEALKPSSLIGMIGSEFSSPLVGILSDKLSTVEEFVTDSVKNSFLTESIENAKIKREEKSNDLLEQIADNTSASGPFSKNEEDKGIIEKGIGWVGDDILGSAFGGGLLALSKKTAKFFPLLLKGLGKLALPIGLLLSAPDFIRGFRQVENISSISGIIDAVQHGIAEVVSAITFGIISPKNIRDALDRIEEGVKEIYRAPLMLIHNILDGQKSISEIIGEHLTYIAHGITFGFISKDKIRKSIDYLINIAKTIISTPINIIKDYLNSQESFFTIVKNNIEEMISNLSFNIFSNEDIISSINAVKNAVIETLTHPVVALQKALNAYTDYLEIPKFDITEPIDKLVNKVLSFVDQIMDAITSIKDRITAAFNEKIDSLSGALDFLFDKVGIGDDKKDEKRFGEKAPTNAELRAATPIDQRKPFVRKVPERPTKEKSAVEKKPIIREFGTRKVQNIKTEIINKPITKNKNTSNNIDTTNNTNTKFDVNQPITKYNMPPVTEKISSEPKVNIKPTSDSTKINIKTDTVEVSNADSKTSPTILNSIIPNDKRQIDSQDIQIKTNMDKVAAPDVLKRQIQLKEQRQTKIEKPQTNNTTVAVSTNNNIMQNNRDTDVSLHGNTYSILGL